MRIFCAQSEIVRRGCSSFRFLSRTQEEAKTSKFPVAMPFFRSRSRCRAAMPEKMCTTSCGKKSCSSCRPNPGPACCPTPTPVPVVCKVKNCCCKKPQPDPKCKTKKCCKCRPCETKVKSTAEACQSSCGGDKKRNCDQPKSGMVKCSCGSCNNSKRCSKSCEQPEMCKTILIKPPPKPACTRIGCRARTPCVSCCRADNSERQPKPSCTACKRLVCNCKKTVNRLPSTIEF